MMKRLNGLRWVAVAAMLCLVAGLLASPALAEETTVLPLDQTVGGSKTIAENWISVSGKEALTDEGVLASGTVQDKVLKYDSKTRTWAPTEKTPDASKFAWQRYEDDTISVRTEFMELIPAKKSVKIPAAVTYIKVADASQIRTAMSNDSYTKKSYVKAEKMAVAKNAVVAVNGDFFKYHMNVGYVVRQGEFYRDQLNGKRDLLAIDSQGDFHWVSMATSESMAAFLENFDESNPIINTFTLGPVLVENGEARVMADFLDPAYGEFQWPYPQQRVAVLQLGQLEYAIVETYGKTDGSQGMNLQELADLIAYLFPDCQLAYNLDGGGSTAVVVNGSRIHQTPGNREISDILYFASAIGE